MKDTLAEIYWPLRLAYGLVPLLAGLDKFFNILADWQLYMSPLLRWMIPVSVETFLHLVGIVEVVVGLAVLLGLARIGGLVVTAWLTAISVNLVLAGFLDIAVRDLVMALGAYTLSMIAAARGEEHAPGPATFPSGALPADKR